MNWWSRWNDRAERYWRYHVVRCDWRGRACDQRGEVRRVRPLCCQARPRSCSMFSQPPASQLMSASVMTISGNWSLPGSGESQEGEGRRRQSVNSLGWSWDKFLPPSSLSLSLSCFNQLFLLTFFYLRISPNIGGRHRKKNNLHLRVLPFS